jgi:hypothetical protein
VNEVVESSREATVAPRQIAQEREVGNKKQNSEKKPASMESRVADQNYQEN